MAILFIDLYRYLCYYIEQSTATPLKKENTMALTKSEEQELCQLLQKMTWPVSHEVFNTLCGTIITNPIELAVLRQTENETDVLMIERHDKFFDGWHIPGTVVCPGDTEESALKRLIEKEVGATVSRPRFIDRMHFPKGTGEGENPRGQEISLLFVCEIGGEYKGPGKFFPVGNIPETTLTSHKVLIDRVRRYLVET